jgi:hypothetical protein
MPEKTFEKAVLFVVLPMVAGILLFLGGSTLVFALHGEISAWIPVGFLAAAISALIAWTYVAKKLLGPIAKRLSWPNK